MTAHNTNDLWSVVRPSAADTGRSDKAVRRELFTNRHSGGSVTDKPINEERTEVATRQ